MGYVTTHRYREHTLFERAVPAAFRGSDYYVAWDAGSVTGFILLVSPETHMAGTSYFLNCCGGALGPQNVELRCGKSGLRYVVTVTATRPIAAGEELDESRDRVHITEDSRGFNRVQLPSDVGGVEFSSDRGCAGFEAFGLAVRLEDSTRHRTTL